MLSLLRSIVFISLLTATVASAQTPRDALWIQEGMTQRVRSVAFSPNGTHVASGLGNGTVRLWNVATGALERVFVSGSGDGITFSPDGGYIVCGPNIIDVETGEVDHYSPRYMESFVAYSKDGQQIAMGGGGTVIVGKKPVLGTHWSFKARVRAGTCVPFSPDGTSILLEDESGDGRINHWSLTSGEKLQTFGYNLHAPVNAIAWHRDQVLTTSRNLIIVRDTSGFDSLRVITTPSPILVMHLSVDGEVAATGHGEGRVTVWRVATGAQLASIDAHDTANGVALTRDGALLATCGSDGTINIWDVASGALQRTMRETPGTGYAEVLDVDISRDGRFVVAGIHTDSMGAKLGSIALFDRSTGQPSAGFRMPRLAQPYSLAISPDGSRIASVSGVTSLVMLNSATGDSIWSQKKILVEEVSFSKDGSMILTGGDDNSPLEIRVLLRNASNGDTIKVFGIGDNPCFVRDGSAIASNDLYGVVRTIDIASGEQIDTLAHKFNRVQYDFASSDDGRYLIVGGTEDIARVWDMTTGELVHTLKGHDYAINGVAIGGDGRYAATASLDGTVRLWDLSDGSTRKIFDSYPMPHTSVRFSNDMQHIVTGTSNGSIILWRSGIGEASARDDHARTNTLGNPTPNPARGEVILPITIDTRGRVELKLFDAMGREAAVIDNGTMEAGEHMLHIDLSALPAGVYVVRSSAGDVRRVVVTR